MGVEVNEKRESDTEFQSIDENIDDGGESIQSYENKNLSDAVLVGSKDGSKYSKSSSTHDLVASSHSDVSDVQSKDREAETSLESTSVIPFDTKALVEDTNLVQPSA